VRRRLLNLLTGLSLLLCVAVCVLWVRSYWVQPPRVLEGFPLHGQLWRLTSNEGRFRVEAWRRDNATAGRLSDRHQQLLGDERQVRDYYHEYLGSRSALGPLPADVEPLARAAPERSGELQSLRYELEMWRRRQRTPWLQTRETSFALPACVLLALAAPGLVSAAVRRRRRRVERLLAEHRCLACGYDLRATPERCPECGTSGRGAGADQSSSPQESAPRRPDTRLVDSRRPRT
jgi:hypothetical protein